MNSGAKQASLGCYRATFTLQYSLCCHAIQPLLHSYSVTIGKRIRDAAFFLIIMLVTFAATLLKPQNYVSS
ncbi:hypothetical protein, partial [Prevotella sp.]|uniref:hypothetical protein n=1 Tax=Prevotella sp. TaxID=59823 RepID=UPI0025F27C59